MRFATERCRTRLNETEKWEVSGRWLESKALAGVLITVHWDGNVMTSQELGEERGS